jgi:hypothetical protein
MPVSRVAAEVNKIAEHILDIGSRAVRIAERPYWVTPALPSAHFPSMAWSKLTTRERVSTGSIGYTELDWKIV